jgi:hypothetical protein
MMQRPSEEKEWGAVVGGWKVPHSRTNVRFGGVRRMVSWTATLHAFEHPKQERVMSEDQATSIGRTPWHLWVIGVLAVLWNSMGAFDYLMTETRNEGYMGSFTPEQLDFFYGFPVWVVAFWAIAVWGGVLGAVLLLLRKKLAAGVLLVSFLSMVVTTIHNFALSNGFQVMGEPFDLAFSAVIFLFALLLYLYAKAMKNRGVLL